MTNPAVVPFFQGNLDQIRELKDICKQRGFEAIAMPPPGGGNS